MAGDASLKGLAGILSGEIDLLTGLKLPVAGGPARDGDIVPHDRHRQRRRQCPDCLHWIRSNQIKGPPPRSRCSTPATAAAPT